MRVVVLLFTIAVTSLALNSQSSIYQMVENAYKVTLVAAFVPLAFGVYWKRATRQGALAAMILGLVSWIFMEFQAPEGMWPPQVVGLLFSLGGMIVGSLLPQAVAPVPQHAQPQ
jgi:solute:Na+ symporter, SSS family